MDAIDKVVRGAAFEAISSHFGAEPSGLPNPTVDSGRGSVPPSETTRRAFSDALAAELRGGFDLVALGVASAAACAAHAAERVRLREIEEEASLHNGAERPGSELDGPLLLLHLSDDALAHLINKLRSDR